MAKRYKLNNHPEYTHTLCVPWIRATKPNTFLQSFPYGTTLNRYYYILESILDNLQYADLKSAAEVSMLWKDIAMKIMSRRRKPTYIYMHNVLRNKVALVVKSDSFNYENISFALIFCNSKQIKLHQYICEHINVSELYRLTLLDFIQKEMIPPNISYCICTTTRIHSSSNKKELPFLSAITIPNIPNIRITQFYINCHKLSSIDYLKENVKENEKFRCIMLFGFLEMENYVSDILTNFLQGDEPTDVTIFGGIVQGTTTPIPMKNISLLHVLCIGFLENGESKFDAYSIVVQKEENYEEKIIEFKANIKLRLNSIALKITCVARPKTKEEGSIFSKYFPTVPIMGIDVNGEIGNNQYKPDNKYDHLFPILHAYTTVILLLTWDN